MSRYGFAVVVGMMAMAAWTDSLRAGSVNLPNGSFESPPTDYIDINIDFWQKGAKPDWYDERGGFLWSQLTGTFTNTNLPPGNPDHLDNCDGNQAIWMFAIPEAALFQDYDSMDWNDSLPTHAFNVIFEVGKSYQLTVGVIGGGGGMQVGVSLELSLYYRDGASNMVTVAATSITNTPAIFSNTTHLVDFVVHVPAVKATDAWAGQNIGVQSMSTVSTNLAGGYWNLDNVRLSAVSEATLRELSSTNGQFKFTLQSEPGLRFEILAATNITQSISNWTSLGTVTNVTGTTPFTDTATSFNRRFYRARQLP